VFGYPQHVLRVCAHGALAWQVKEWEAEFKLLRLELLGKELQSRVETASELKGTKEGSLIQQEMRKLIESLVEIQPCWVWAMERCSWHLRQSIGAPREAIDLCQSVLKRLLEEERPVDDKMLIAVPGVMMDKEEEFGHQKLMNVEKAEDRKYLHERMEFQLVHAQMAEASASSAIITPQLRAQFDRLQRSTQARKERLVQLYQQKKSGVAGAAADGLGKDDEALKLKRQLIQQEVARAKARELCSQQRHTEGMEQMSDERSIMIRQQQQQMMAQPGQMTSVQERMHRRLAKRKDEEKQSLGPEACGDIKASGYVSQLSSEDLRASLRVECDKLWNQVLQAHSRLQQEQQSGIEYVHHIVAHTLNHPEARWLGRWYLGETFPFAHESQFLTIVSTLLWRTLVQATKNRIVKKWEEDPDLKALPWSRGDKESEKREAMNEYLLHNRQDHQSGLDMTEEIVSLLGDNKDLEAGRPFEEVVEHCADLGKLHRVCMNVFEKRVRRAIDSIQETMEQRVPFIRELEQNAGAGFQLEHQLNVSTNFPPGNALEREREGERERFRPNEKMEFVFWFLKDRITFDNDLQWVLMQQVAQDLEQHFKDNPSHTQNDLQGHEHAVLSREVGYVHAIKERMLDLAPHYEVYGSQDTQEMLTLIMKNGEESKDFQDHTSAHGLFVDQPGSMCDEDITNGAHEHQGGNDIPAEGREPRIFSVHGKGFDMVVNHHESLETRRRHQFYEKMDQFIERATTWAAQVKIFSQLDALYREAFWLRSKLVCLLQSAGGGGVLEEQYGEWLQHLVYFMEESADLAEKTREAHTLHSRILVRRILCALWNKQHEERRYMDDDCRPEHKVEDTTHYVSQLARQIDVHQTKLMQLRDGLMQVAQQVSASAAQGGDAGMHPEEVADMALLGMFLAGATNSNNASKCADTGQNLQKIDAKFEDMRRLIDNIHEEAQNFKGLKEELRLVTGPADQCVGQYHEVVRDIAICMIREEMLNKAKEVEMERKKREQEEQAQRAQEDLLKNEEESEAIRRREEEKKAKKKAKEREKKEKERLEKERLREEEEARKREEEERERKLLEEQQRKEQEKREAEIKRKREEEEKMEKERQAQLKEQELQQAKQKQKQQPLHQQQSQQQQSITATTKSKTPKQQLLLQVEQPQPQQHQQACIGAAPMQHQACPAVSAGTGFAAATGAVDVEKTKTQPATTKTDAPPTPEHAASEGKEAVAGAEPATTSATCKLSNGDPKNGSNGNVNSPRNNAGVKTTSSKNQARVGAPAGAEGHGGAVVNREGGNDEKVRLNKPIMITPPAPSGVVSAVNSTPPTPRDAATSAPGNRRQRPKEQLPLQQIPPQPQQQQQQTSRAMGREPEQQIPPQPQQQQQQQTPRAMGREPEQQQQQASGQLPANHSQGNQGPLQGSFHRKGQRNSGVGINRSPQPVDSLGDPKAANLAAAADQAHANLRPGPGRAVPGNNNNAMGGMGAGGMGMGGGPGGMGMGNGSPGIPNHMQQQGVGYGGGGPGRNQPAYGGRGQMNNLDENTPNGLGGMIGMGNIGAGAMAPGMGAGIGGPAMTGPYSMMGAGAMGAMGNIMGHMANTQGTLGMGMGMGPMGMPNMTNMGLNPSMMNSNMMGGGMGGPGGNFGPNSPHTNHHHNHVGHHFNQSHQDAGQHRRGGKVVYGSKGGYGGVQGMGGYGGAQGGHHTYQQVPYNNNAHMQQHQAQPQPQHQQHQQQHPQRQAHQPQPLQTQPLQQITSHTQASQSKKSLSVGASEFVPSFSGPTTPKQSQEQPALTTPRGQAPSTPASVQAHQMPGMQQVQQIPMGNMQTAQHAQVPGIQAMSANVQQHKVPSSPVQVPGASPMLMASQSHAMQTTPTLMHAGKSPSSHVVASSMAAPLEPLSLTPQTDPAAAGALHKHPPVGTAQEVSDVQVRDKTADQGLSSSAQPQHPPRVPSATPIERAPAVSVEQASQQLEQDADALSPLTNPTVAAAEPTPAASSLTPAPGASSSAIAHAMSQSALYGLVFRPDQLVGPAQDLVWGPSHGEGLNSNGEFSAQDLGTAFAYPFPLA
jgi:actin-related protein